MLSRIQRLWFFAPLLLTAGPGFVNNCKPCIVRPGPKLPAYRLFFDLADDEGGRVVRSINVNRGWEQEPIQTLAVRDMMPDNGGKFFFDAVDLDFDGYLDLMLITAQGTANASADYWLFKPKSGIFAYAGNYPVFKVDRLRRVLSTYERGGLGGMLFTKSEYRVENGKVRLDRTESQESTGEAGVFRRIVKEREGAKMKTVKSELLRGEAARPQ